jgi:ribose transport system ATP-binding protein
MSGAQTDARLVMQDVAKSFGPVRALDSVALTARAGEVHALIGENGAGKSTLMKILSGAYRPDAGAMFLDGQPYEPRDPREARRSGVAMIYQELAIAPHLTVEANVMLGGERTVGGLIRHREHRRRVAEALELLGHAEISPDAVAGRLPLPARQLIEVARALVSDARVVVFDEPTAVLGEADVARLFTVIERLRSRGLAVLYISHFLEEVRQVAQSYTVLRDGRTAATGRMSDAAVGDLVAAMLGRPLGEMFPRTPHSPGPPILELTGLAGQHQPRGVNLVVHRGEILGVAGLVGAGRTETLRVLFGLDRQTQGMVVLRGAAGGWGDPPRRIAQGFGMLSEDRQGEGLAVRRSIEENLTLSAVSRHSRLGWIRLRSCWDATRRWTEALQIRSRDPGQPVEALSGGNQQKVALGRLLEQNAEIILLDEPTRGIDVGSKVEIYRLMGELAARGKTILMVSSYLPELLGVCDRIAVMRRGVVVEVRPADQWTEHALLQAATGG